jgi:hypothetical protein
MRTTDLRVVLLAALALMTGTGCATYEFDLVEPPNLRTHIGRRAMTTVRVEPLAYSMQAVEGRLVMFVENPTDEPVQLLGDRCWVVDANGVSHPLPRRTIAPAGRIKLIFPPPRPRYDRGGPTFGVGVGVSAHHYGRHEFMGVYDPWYDEPRYVTVYDDASDLYYDWPGESSIRISLFYRRGDADGAGAGADGQTFRHELAIQRGKV